MCSSSLKHTMACLQLDMMDCKNTQDVLLWKIIQIRRQQMREAVSGDTPLISSQPFCTFANCYKMKAQIFLNGNGRGHGMHLSLFFRVMRGEYDSLLPWPGIPNRVILVLLDQDDHHHNSDTFITIAVTTK